MSQAVQSIQLLAGTAGDPIVLERVAGAASIVPGDLLEVNSSNALIVHNSAAEIAERMFALEALSIAGSIDTAYGNGDTLRAGIFHAGQLVNARLAAAAPAVVVGDKIESAGDGTIRKAVPIVVLTDSSGGTGNDVIAEITNALTGVVDLTDNSTGAANDVIAAITAATIVALTDNGGGAATDDVIASITNSANAGSADVAPVADAVKELSTKINEFQAVGVTPTAAIADAIADLAAKISEILAISMPDTAAVANAVADLAAKVNELLAQSPSQNVIAIATEAVDNSGGGTKVRLEIRII